MDTQILHAQRDYWNQHFAQSGALPVSESHWLDVLTTHSSVRLAGTVLEIGCGRGYDTKRLLDAGCNVTCLDLSWHALQRIADISRAVHLVNAALPAPLPFRTQSFATVVAGLSLHYFPWQETCMIMQEISRVLIPDGTLIFRVNSTEDAAHGAGRGVEIEPHLFYHEGRFKRFFTERMCQDLFDDSWQVEVLMPWIETRAREVKPTWMGIAHHRQN